MLTCEILSTGQLRFSVTCETCTSGTPLPACLTEGKARIVEALANKALGIRALTRADITLMGDRQFSNGLCGDMDINLPPLLNELAPHQDPSNVLQKSGRRLTWVTVSLRSQRLLLGFCLLFLTGLPMHTQHPLMDSTRSTLVWPREEVYT